MADNMNMNVSPPEDDEAGMLWAQGVTREWAADLADPRQDVYTLEDGQPFDTRKDLPSQPGSVIGELHRSDIYDER
jgi:hypothetical protein